jgi:hypothetical protein
VAAAVVAARWYANRADELGRRRDFPLVSVVLLAVLAAGAATPGVLWARQERRLAAVASALAAYVRSGGRRPSRAQVVAVHVLAHEAMHMAGLVQEHAAECAAVQRDARAARLLGASPDDARALAVAYWRTVYPAMPDGYRSTACRPGGTLDEHLPDAPWAPGS